MNKKAQIGETITWFVAFVLIFFIMLLFTFSCIFISAAKGVKSQDYTAYGNSQNIARTENLLVNLNIKHEINGISQENWKSLQSFSNDLLTSNKIYSDHQFVYSSDNPFFQLSSENQIILGYLITDLDGYSKPCVLNNNMVSYPIIIFEVNDKRIIDYQPGLNYAKIDPLKTKEVYISLKEGMFGKLTLSETVAIPKSTHERYYQSLNVKDSSGTGGLLDIGRQMSPSRLQEGSTQKSVEVCLVR